MVMADYNAGRQQSERADSTAIMALVDRHFDSLKERDIFVVNDGLSRVYRPCTLTGTPLDHAMVVLWKILVRRGVGQFRHINYFTFHRFFEEIARISAPLRIVETGSSAYGVSSSRLLGALSEVVDGAFDTVDLNPKTNARVAAELAITYPGSTRQRAHCGDSVAFLRSMEGAANVVYLDSYDLDPDHYDEAAAHGLAEFDALLPKLDPAGAVILIDDTPGTRAYIATQLRGDNLAKADAYLAKRGFMPGKGATIARQIKGDPRFEILAWEYQLLIAYRAKAA
jgi:Methyltransferase domain